MSDPAIVYHQASRLILLQKLDLLKAPLRVLLLTSAYTPDAGHTLADVRRHEVTGEGYAVGGLPLGGRAWEEDGGHATLSAAECVWPEATLTARYAVVHDGRVAVCCHDLRRKGQDVTSTGGDFTLSWPGGVLTCEEE